METHQKTLSIIIIVIITLFCVSIYENYHSLFWKPLTNTDTHAQVETQIKKTSLSLEAKKVKPSPKISADEQNIPSSKHLQNPIDQFPDYAFRSDFQSGDNSLIYLPKNKVIVPSFREAASLAERWTLSPIAFPQYTNLILLREGIDSSGAPPGKLWEYSMRTHKLRPLININKNMANGFSKSLLTTDENWMIYIPTFDNKEVPTLSTKIYLFDLVNDQSQVLIELTNKETLTDSTWASGVHLEWVEQDKSIKYAVYEYDKDNYSSLKDMVPHKFMHFQEITIR